MSMTVFLIIQLVGMSFAYFGVTTILPMIVFYKKLQHRRMTDRILLSYLFGNVYIVTIVQVLQLLHISYAITLIIAIVVPALVVWIKLNHIPVVKIYKDIVQNAKWLAERQLGIKTVVYRLMAVIKKSLKKKLKAFARMVYQNIFELLFVILLTVALWWVYGIGIVEKYGYLASDLPVHNYWINAMSDNNIFVAGVYPHGYHCIIYFLHEVFGFKTYILLSLFAFVQIICINMALLLSLKLCCKSRYLPHIGTFAYAVGNFFIYATYSRFSGTLPQEYGMIFILPAIAYGFMFFQERYTEVKEQTESKESIYSLWGFAMSFGMTLSVHFYNTIIAALFCIAMAVGYLFLFVRKQYFKSVVVTCFISVLVAILPMVIAFATGTPLQGSLTWATEVISESMNSGTSDTTTSDTTTTEDTSTTGDTVATEDTAVLETLPDNNIQVDSEGAGGSDNSDINTQIEKEHKKTVGERFEEKFDKIKIKVQDVLKSVEQNVWAADNEWQGKLLLWSVAALFFLGFLYIVLKKCCYGAMLWSCAIYMILMSMVLGAGKLGIPSLMNPARACIYYAYSIPVLFVIVADAILYLLTGLGRFKRISKAFSLVCLVVVVGLMLKNNAIRPQLIAGGFETNEAVTCLTSIIRQEEDFTWTICSANDELRMGEDHGYHYETITFLKKMEHFNSKTIITIPTPKVFFFIEKVPLDYAVSYENSGQSISEEGASRKLTYSTGLAPYQGENRWVTMSRMYYWAQEFMRMYPNEMKVYMETDRFVCYVVEQNTYSLYNFAIDYGYNMGEQQDE